MKLLKNTIVTITLSLSFSLAIEVGEQAPDFTLQSLDHGEISLSDYNGKVVYLFFLGNGCPPCIGHAPLIETNIYNQYSHEEVQVLGIDIWSGGLPSLQNFKNSTNVTFPLLNAGSSVASSLYDIFRQDVTVIIDQEGLIAHFHDNYPSNLDIQGSKNVISELLAITDIVNPEINLYTYKLNNNYPNPFNPSTIISYQLAGRSPVSLKIFDITGREIFTLVDEWQEAGNYFYSFNAGGLASGIYFYKIEAGYFSRVKQMLLVK
jgi:peroxiredoxin